MKSKKIIVRLIDGRRIEREVPWPENMADLDFLLDWDDAIIAYRLHCGNQIRREYLKKARESIS